MFFHCRSGAIWVCQIVFLIGCEHAETAYNVVVILRVIHNSKSILTRETVRSRLQLLNCCFEKANEKRVRVRDVMKADPQIFVSPENTLGVDSYHISFNDICARAGCSQSGSPKIRLSRKHPRGS